jgi:hypothetical protein
MSDTIVAMDPRLFALCRARGCFLRRDALELGYGDGEIARLVRDGLWVRLGHGAYTLAAFWHDAGSTARHLMVSRAAQRTAQTGAILSHTSSLCALGVDFWGLPLDDVHLTRRDGRVGRRGAGVVQHCGTVVAGDVIDDGGFAHMSPTRTALEITMMTDVERGLVVVNSFLHAGMTTVDELRSRYAAMEQWPHSLQTDLVLRLCDPRPESVAETRCDVLFFRQGLPRPVPQFEVRDGSGRLIGRLDFAWPPLGVWLEFDGRVKYDQLRRSGETEVDVLMREKRREELIREVTGWECIRITWADLAHPERVAARIRAAFARSARRQG